MLDESNIPSDRVIQIIADFANENDLTNTQTTSRGVISELAGPKPKQKEPGDIRVAIETAKGLNEAYIKFIPHFNELVRSQQDPVAYRAKLDEVRLEAYRIGQYWGGFVDQLVKLAADAKLPDLKI